MANNSQTLLREIEAFIAATGMGESYFGKRAVNNSELVPRLRRSGRVWPETEERVRGFMRDHLPTPVQPHAEPQAPAPKRAGGSA
jgi:hypothetical protein